MGFFFSYKELPRQYSAVSLLLLYLLFCQQELHCTVCIHKPYTYREREREREGERETDRQTDRHRERQR